MAPLSLPATVFLDRDGVLNVKAADDEYVTTPDAFRWIDGALDALRKLQGGGCRLVVVTNQRGVARGRMSGDDLDAIHARMTSDLAGVGVTLGGIYACTHEAGSCDCRKPGTGLFLAAMRDLPAIEVATSAVVGDALSDVEAANRLGSAAYLIVPSARRESELQRAAERSLRVDAAYPTLRALVAEGFGLA